LDLVSDVPGIDHLCGLPEDWEHDSRELGCDNEIDVTELPHAFRTNDRQRSPRRCRIYGRSRRKSQRAPPVGALGRLPQGGLCWAAGAWKPERSLSPDELAPLMAVSDVAFVSLQRARS